MRSLEEVKSFHKQAAHMVTGAVTVQQLIATRAVLDTLAWVLQDEDAGSLDKELYGLERHE